MTTRAWRTGFQLAVVALAALAAGCTTRQVVPHMEDAPKELHKIMLPDYVIEPPDVIQLNLIAAVPKPPYKIQTLDAIAVRAKDVLPEAPIANIFSVEADGTINLGFEYGSVSVVGMSVQEAKKAIETQLLKTTRKPLVEVSLAQTRGMEQVRGQHLVRPDGAIGLGNYGAIRIVGQTIPEAKKTIETHLAQYFMNPEVSIDITGFNSKVYYVVTDGGGNGTQLHRLPITGNETVIDAFSQIGGLSGIADFRKIWISRPSAEQGGCPQILPVNWRAITEQADIRTNYQLLPGDRLFVNAIPVVTFTNRFEKAIAPIERILGFSLLGVGAYQNFRNINTNFNGINNGNNLIR